MSPSSLVSLGLSDTSTTRMRRHKPSRVRGHPGGSEKRLVRTGLSVCESIAETEREGNKERKNWKGKKNSE